MNWSRDGIESQDMTDSVPESNGYFRTLRQELKGALAESTHCTDVNTAAFRKSQKTRA
jgi:hypothetical protein